MSDQTSAGATPGDVGDARLLALRAEVDKLIAEAHIGARRAQRRAKLWHATYLSLGFPAAVLAGISGAAGLASAGARVPAAILALLAAGFSAGSTFLRADARHMTNLRRRYAWQHLETRARLVLAYDAYQGPERLHTALLGLHELRIAVPSSALILAEQQSPTYQAPVGVPAPPFPQPAVELPPFPQPAVQSPSFPQPAVQPPTLMAPTVQQLPAPAPAAQPPAIPQAPTEPSDPVG
ncbi:hypothetical protein ABZS79_22495 [Streptomyces griseoloalbus]|uniref:hypothetical protein n=1 Tax=Streptomyces griseoloalbus TaxID=67303 RepID=UPI0033AA94C7